MVRCGYIRIHKYVLCVRLFLYMVCALPALCVHLAAVGPCYLVAAVYQRISAGEAAALRAGRCPWATAAAAGRVLAAAARTGDQAGPL